MPIGQARAALDYAYNRPIHFVFYGKRWKVRPNALGSSLDVEGTIKNAVNAPQGETVPLAVTVDSARVAQYSRFLDRWLSVEPENATATLTKRLTPVLHPAKAGLAVRASPRPEFDYKPRGCL